jgi:hypothetical protein
MLIKFYKITVFFLNNKICNEWNEINFPDAGIKHTGVVVLTEVYFVT